MGAACCPHPGPLPQGEGENKAPLPLGEGEKKLLSLRERKNVRPVALTPSPLPRGEGERAACCPHPDPLPQGEGENKSSSPTGRGRTCGLLPSPQPSPTGRGRKQKRLSHREGEALIHGERVKILPVALSSEPPPTAKNPPAAVPVA